MEKSRRSQVRDVLLPKNYYTLAATVCKGKKRLRF
jgi:hypothetical protein